MFFNLKNNDGDRAIDLFVRFMLIPVIDELNNIHKLPDIFNLYYLFLQSDINISLQDSFGKTLVENLAFHNPYAIKSEPLSHSSVDINSDDNSICSAATLLVPRDDTCNNDTYDAENNFKVREKDNNEFAQNSQETKSPRYNTRSYAREKLGERSVDINKMDSRILMTSEPFQDRKLQKATKR